MVEHLPRKGRALGLILSSGKREREEEKEKGEGKGEGGRERMRKSYGYFLDAN